MAGPRVPRLELPFFAGKRDLLLGDPRKLQLKIVIDRAAVLRNSPSSADCVLSLFASFGLAVARLQAWTLIYADPGLTPSAAICRCSAPGVWWFVSV